MNIIPRIITQRLQDLAKKFPVISVLGPRQSGKTTLCRSTFPGIGYVNLEDPMLREFAITDPKGFLAQYQNQNKKGVIIDEIQHVPMLFSYIQIIVDELNQPGLFILTGSQNFLLNSQISQSLAGRVAILTLLPFSIKELKSVNLLPNQYESLLLSGGYPRLWNARLTSTEMYSSYVQTYLERDIRQLKHITDLHIFQKFLRLCAGRVGGLLNYSQLAADVGVSVNTVKSWISLLEASYVIFLLQPYYKNFSKRLIKAPKMYFIDSGVACYLLNITSIEQLQNHPLKGNLFENLIVSELSKYSYNQAETPSAYFWKNRSGFEVDVVFERQGKIFPIEIKSAATFHSSFFNNLLQFKQLNSDIRAQNFVIYGGNENQKRKEGVLLSWNELPFAYSDHNDYQN